MPVNRQVSTQGAGGVRSDKAEGSMMSVAMIRAVRSLALTLGLLALTACGASTDGPISPKVSTWSLQDVSVGFGPDISRTASGDQYGSNFVWSGFNDANGNRKRQIVALFQSAMREVGTQTMTGTTPVKMQVTVTYFHALTEYGRVWCCGEHRIYADLAVVDAQTGTVLVEDKNVYLGRLALGGIPGLVAEASGRDQVTRVREGIVMRTRDWLARF